MPPIDDDSVPKQRPPVVTTVGPSDEEREAAEERMRRAHEEQVALARALAEAELYRDATVNPPRPIRVAPRLLTRLLYVVFFPAIFLIGLVRRTFGRD